MKVILFFRIVIEECFEKYSELEQILQFSTPKVLRLIGILRHNRPVHFVDPRNRHRDVGAEVASVLPTVTSDGALPTAAAASNTDANNTSDNAKCHGVQTLMDDYNLGHVMHEASITEVSEEEISRLTKQGWFDKKSDPEVLKKEEKMPFNSNTECLVDEDHEDVKEKMCVNKHLRVLDDMDRESVDSYESCLERMEDLAMDDRNLSSKFVISTVQNIPDLVCNGKCAFVNGHPTHSTCEREGFCLDGCNGSLTPDVFSSCAASPVKCLNTKVSSACDSTAAMNESLGVTSSDDESSLNKTILCLSSADGEDNLINGNSSNHASVPTSSCLSLSSSAPSTYVLNDTLIESFNSKFSAPKVTNSDEKCQNISDVNAINASNSVDICHTRRDFPAANSNSKATTAPDQQPMLRGNKRRKGDIEIKEKVKVHNPDDPDSVCGLIFVDNGTTAKMIYRLLKELSDIGGDFAWVFPQYTVEVGEATADEKILEQEQKKQEEVLRRFRHLECNMLVATKVLEQGIDVPPCTMVLRFDPACSFQSYIYSTGRARPSRNSHVFHLVDVAAADTLLHNLAMYTSYQQVSDMFSTNEAKCSVA